MRNHRNLLVWQKAHQLGLEVYRATASFPSTERFHLVDQMRRAAVSITSNIAEGAGRDSSAEFRHYLAMASGSTSELQSQLEFARDLGFINDEWRVLDALTSEIKRMLNALRKKTR